VDSRKETSEFTIQGMIQLKQTVEAFKAILKSLGVFLRTEEPLNIFEKASDMM
jgi:hypothetical protein